jgi:hypothetical protein
VLSVVNAADNSAVGAEPFPDVPAANICTLALMIGEPPARTFPVNAGVFDVVPTMVIGLIEFDAHPESAATAVNERRA